MGFFSGLDEAACTSKRGAGVQQTPAARLGGHPGDSERLGELLVLGFVAARNASTTTSWKELRGERLSGSVDRSERHRLASTIAHLLCERPLVISLPLRQEDLRVTPLGGSDVVNVRVFVRQDLVDLFLRDHQQGRRKRAVLKMREVGDHHVVSAREQESEVFEDRPRKIGAEPARLGLHHRTTVAAILFPEAAALLFD